MICTQYKWYERDKMTYDSNVIDKTRYSILTRCASSSRCQQIYARELSSPAHMEGNETSIHLTVRSLVHMIQRSRLARPIQNYENTVRNINAIHNTIMQE